MASLPSFLISGMVVFQMKKSLKSGFLDLVEHSDNIMADRGFNMEELLADCGAVLNFLPFRDENTVQLTQAQVEETRRIETVRIHAERCNGYAKNFRILESTMPNL